MVRVLMPLLVSVLLAGCARFSAKHITSYSACEYDLEKPVQMARLTFTPAPFWSRLQPCGAQRISEDTRGRWTIESKGVFRYKDIHGLTNAISMGIITRTNQIGLGREYTPEEWLEREGNVYEKTEINNIGTTVKMKFTRVERQGMTCWRSKGRFFRRQPKPPHTLQQNGENLWYDCWPPSQRPYPEITIRTNRSYHDGKPLFPEIDLERDILTPVFASLEVKELSDQDYNRLVEKNREWRREFCEEEYDSYKKSLRERGIKPNDARMHTVERCGYSDARALRCAAWERDKDKLQQDYFHWRKALHYAYLDDLTEVMRTCGYSEQAIADYHRQTCANTLEVKRKHLQRNPRGFIYRGTLEYLERCGYGDTETYKEGMKRWQAHEAYMKKIGRTIVVSE